MKSENIAVQISDEVVTPVKSTGGGTPVLCGAPVGWKPPSAPEDMVAIEAKGKMPAFKSIDDPGE